ncbi:MAG TPA: restriction endonuclease, partial [Rubrivivax sp.]
PFVLVGAIAARRQWRLPGAAQTERTVQALNAMTWPGFSKLLEEAFRRDGYTVRPGTTASVDFELERGGRHTLVCARRWKSARTGVEVLRALHAARTACDASGAMVISLGELTDSARPFATEHAITLWQAPELALALRGLLPEGGRGGT